MTLMYQIHFTREDRDTRGPAVGQEYFRMEETLLFILVENDQPVAETKHIRGWEMTGPSDRGKERVRRHHLGRELGTEQEEALTRVCVH